MAMEHRFVEYDYARGSGAANDYSTDSELDAMSAAGWVMKDTDVSNHPFLRVLWVREIPPPKQESRPDPAKPKPGRAA